MFEREPLSPVRAWANLYSGTEEALKMRPPDKTQMTPQLLLVAQSQQGYLDEA